MAEHKLGALTLSPSRVRRVDRFVRHLTVSVAPWQIVVMIATLALTSLAAGNGVFTADVRFTRWVQDAPATVADPFAAIVNEVGSTIPSAAITLTLSALLISKRRHGPALIVLATFVARGSNVALKWLADSPRPTENLVTITDVSSGMGFPSGHVMGAVLLYGSLILVAGELVSHRRRWAVLAIAWLMIAGMGFSRIYSGAHWPSDVLGAYLWGGLALFGVHHLYRRFWSERSDRIA